MQCICDAKKVSNPITPEVRYLATSLVKTGTKCPMMRSEVLPMESFMLMFKQWPDNNTLTLVRLHFKTLMQLSFAVMLRPLYIAPKGRLYNPTSGEFEPMVFTIDPSKRICVLMVAWN